ncbi:amidohydrolase [Streptomyces griseocarneus]|nr:amidohydrolase [Streptomyces griseocarneus]
MEGKIALEEHLSTPLNDALWDATGEAERNGKTYMADVRAHLADAGERVALMDEHGIGTAILSLTSPGAQSVLDPREAVDFARETNDTVKRDFVDAHPGRLEFFAAVALQDPQAAADELDRAVRRLGAKGALVNGYTNIGDPGTGRYLDHPDNAPFWAKAAELGVPVYLHPREPLPAGHYLYEGYDSLTGSAWGFGHETATHAVRLMLSGLFDTHPGLQIILGHLGEGLPFLLPRLEHRLRKQREGTGLGRARRRVGEYFQENFLLTTAGHFHTPALRCALEAIGSDRVLFSADYPYETMAEAAAWFDAAPLCDNDRVKIGRNNALRIFNLVPGPS